MSAVFSSILRAIPPVHREGWPFIAAFAVVTLLLFWLSDILGMIGLGLTLWCVAFFRDPVRRVPIDPTLVLAPADGEVSFVGPVRPPVELGLGDMPMTRISVFMSVFDCHVNRMPVMGTVSRIIYTPGAFVNADLDKASEQNERNALIVETAENQTFAVVQIAGLVARRIVNFAQQGQGLGAGDRFGLIRFGSRVDVYLPEGFAPTVAEGQRAVAGETPIATTQPVSLTVRAI